MASTVKLYLDTSVLGAIFDTEPVGRKEITQLFFQTVQPFVLSESRESLSLAQEYVAARVIPASSRDDARHVAIATLAGSEALVSWNFRHLVNLKRKRLVHSVNIRLGHPLIELVSPEEVIYE